MSFNYRFYNWDKIKEFSKTDKFKNFDKWLIKPDGAFFEDNHSALFSVVYGSYRKEKKRKKIYKLLSYKNNSFVIDLLKLLNKRKKKNYEISKEKFISKWKKEKKKYKKIINKNGK
jgi:hypothetical protein